MQKLAIKIKFSCWYAAFLYGVHALACLIMVILAVPLWTKFLGILLVLVSAYFIPRKIQPVLELVHTDGKRWHLRTKRQRHSALLSDRSWISPYAAVLIFEVPGQKKMWSVVLFPDAVDKASLRQLILCLNIT